MAFGQNAKHELRVACAETGLESAVERIIELPNKEARREFGAVLGLYEGEEGARQMDWPGEPDFLPQALQAIRKVRDRL